MNGPARTSGAQPSEGEQRAVAALEGSGLRYRLVRHGPVRSSAEAAAARRVGPDRVIKTLVVRRGEGDYLFVLVPGDRTISWPKLRELLGVSRMAMPDADVALAVTGYARGTITPFGSTYPWPVVADARVAGHPVSIGAGAPGVSATVDGSQMVLALGATVADVTDPVPAVTDPPVAVTDPAADVTDPVDLGTPDVARSSYPTEVGGDAGITDDEDR